MLVLGLFIAIGRLSVNKARGYVCACAHVFTCTRVCISVYTHIDMFISIFLYFFPIVENRKNIDTSDSNPSPRVHSGVLSFCICSSLLPWLPLSICLAVWSMKLFSYFCRSLYRAWMSLSPCLCSYPCIDTLLISAWVLMAIIIVIFVVIIILGRLMGQWNGCFAHLLDHLLLPSQKGQSQKVTGVFLIFIRCFSPAPSKRARQLKILNYYPMFRIWWLIPSARSFIVFHLPRRNLREEK